MAERDRAGNSKVESSNPSESLVSSFFFDYTADFQLGARDLRVTKLHLICRVFTQSELNESVSP